MQFHSDQREPRSLNVHPYLDPLALDLIDYFLLLVENAEIPEKTSLLDLIFHFPRSWVLEVLQTFALFPSSEIHIAFLPFSGMFLHQLLAYSVFLILLGRPHCSR